ncbi:D-glycero-beta-D-manno-heptose 1,7-bisphosphate 7-phosphatase [Ferrimonas balearica]|uniref:D-glycero-beta-D-manno-heptose 1,7-bisphosphate 7-phosphatase n=1 Tax=Ferrimonas balearica TaxID=44012 RepID=UPI001C99F2D6|nr:D-glycero-beta-D-manno-heptose 1,7-bisphosphate 7-phosphatase [Ferrimonas balearica]MBY5922350.1 D-glycero-beta-D-manno-heptose 1,7-bisphosphate 7-phosphatase [Ferrimonas balearica]MBY5994310.1 D-glycero-beta-D-manno-heptose 1,7-bisphosphate 7-phosphatase [Ferrimonas balearica]
MRPAVFLDRDGVINRDHGYVGSIDAFEFLPGVLESCAALVKAGFALVVVTNQSGIARGYYDEQQFRQLSAWMSDQFTEAGAPLAGVYHCPHHPDKGDAPYRMDCDCRKPNPGMLLTAARELDLMLASSYMVGDKLSDIEAGKGAGVKATLFIGDGSALNNLNKGEAPDWCGPDLPSAVAWIAENRQKPAKNTPA